LTLYFLQVPAFAKII